MPQIRQYVSNAELRPDNMNVQAEQELGYHSDRSAQMAGREYEAGGRALEQGVNAVEHHMAAQEVSGVYTKMANLTVAAHQHLTDTLASADPSKGEPLTAWNENYLQPEMDKIGEDLNTPQAQEEFTRMRASMTSSLLDRGMGEWGDQMKVATVNNVKQTADSLANAAAVDPASISSIASQSDYSVDAAAKAAAAAGTPVSADQIKALKTQARQKIYDASASRIVSQVESNPNANAALIGQVREKISTPEFQQNLSPGTMVQLQDRLDKARHTRVTAASGIIKSEMPSVLKQVELGADPANAEKLIANYSGATPEETETWKTEATQQLAAAKAIYLQRRAMENMSNAEVDTYLQNLQTGATSADPAHAREAMAQYNAAKAYQKQRQDEFGKDQAAYETKNNQTIGALYTRFENSRNPEDFATYAHFSIANQQLINPSTAGKLVTPEMKQEWAAKVGQIKVNGAPAAQAMMAEGIKQYGRFWPRVAQELADDKVLTGPQFVAATLYGRPQAYGIANDLLQASVMPWKTLVADASVKGVTESEAVTAAATAMAPYRKTLQNVSNGQEIADAYQDALARVLLYKGDTSIAGSIAGQMITDSYDIDGATRIPTWKGLDTGKVKTGLGHAFDKVDFDNIVVPPSFSGLGPRDQRTNYIESVKATGTWHTNGSDTGVILYDAAGHNVLTKVGNTYKPVTLTWQQLTDLGEQHLSIIDRSYRLFTGKPQ